MLNAGLISPLTSLKVHRNLRRYDDHVAPNRQREILEDFHPDENRDAFVQTQTGQTSGYLHLFHRRSAIGSAGRQTADNFHTAQLSRDMRLPVAEGVTWKAWLNDALEELADCPAAAVEEGTDEPSELGLARAEVVLRGIAGFANEQPDIYPMDEGSIVIDLRRPEIGTSVIVVVDQDGSGALFFRTSGKRGRVRVKNAIDLLKERELLDIDVVGSR